MTISVPSPLFVLGCRPCRVLQVFRNIHVAQEVPDSRCHQYLQEDLQDRQSPANLVHLCLPEMLGTWKTNAMSLKFAKHMGKWGKIQKPRLVSPNGRTRECNHAWFSILRDWMQDSAKFNQQDLILQDLAILEVHFKKSIIKFSFCLGLLYV